MKILHNSDKQLIVAMKDSITILFDDNTCVVINKNIIRAAADTFGSFDTLRQEIARYSDEYDKVYNTNQELKDEIENYKTEIRNLRNNFDQVTNLCEERESIINECNQKIIDYEEIIKDLTKTNEYYIRKKDCATPVKECDDNDSSYPPTKVK
jgi:septal ring factor EnvC (AmiA/AmiB activator)